MSEDKFQTHDRRPQDNADATILDLSEPLGPLTDGDRAALMSDSFWESLELDSALASAVSPNKPAPPIAGKSAQANFRVASTARDGGGQASPTLGELEELLRSSDFPGAENFPGSHSVGSDPFAATHTSPDQAHAEKAWTAGDGTSPAPGQFPPAGEAPLASGSDHVSAASLDQLIQQLESETVSAAQFSGAGSSVTAAASAKSTAQQENLLQHVIFSVGGSICAFPIRNVTEIGRPLAITSLPFVPEWVLGVSNLRGDILSIVNFSTFLGLEPGASGNQARMLVLKSMTDDIQVGLLVETVHEISYLPERAAMPTGPVDEAVTPFLLGVLEQDDRIIALLDAERLLQAPKLRQFDSTLTTGA